MAEIFASFLPLEESCPPLASGTDIHPIEGFSEPVHSLLLLPRQFDGALLSGVGVYPLEKIALSKFYAGHLLRKNRCCSG